MTGHYCIDPAQVQALSEKANGLTGWLTENAPYCETSQKHLETGTVEQAYWHYGYLCASRDILALLSRPSSE
jgi:hypothetical protein